MEDITDIFTTAVSVLEHTLFYSIHGMPLIVAWLLLGAVFLTFRLEFINIRGFTHGLAILTGHYDDPDDPGEVTHFQALATALSATIGLGNIAGVAIAIQLGGPGAVLWMTLAGFLGMTSKFVECTLAQKYRIVQPDGRVLGGPMYYLSQGLADIGLGTLGKILATAFSVFCLFGAIGNNNLFQANQSSLLLGTIAQSLWGGDLTNYRWIYGLLLALVVGLVIVGGIRRIARIAATVVPAMAALYLFAVLWILSLHLTEIPGAMQTIWQSAWHPQAIEGGVLGVMVQGLRRGVVSNEAGIGSAAIAHAVTRTDKPIREGFVAMLEPFIDTVIICNLTALVCLVTGAYQETDVESINITLVAFTSEIPSMSWGLALIVCLFSFSTIVSWFFYGESSWRYLFGEQGLWSYKLLYTGCVFVGTVTSLEAVLTFGDIMYFAMGLPSMLGALLLSNQVADSLRNYQTQLLQSQSPHVLEKS